MYESQVISDIFYYIFPALFGGVVFVYVVKKLLSLSYSRQNLNISDQSSVKYSSELKSENNNHYSNGSAIKVNGTKLVNSSISNNEFKDTEVLNEDKTDSSSSSDHSIDCTNDESKDQTSEDEEKTEVFECVTQTSIQTTASKPSRPLSSEFKVQDVTDLAAIILTDDKRKDWFEIICITSGSDVIDARNLRPEFVVVDCRAPVLARRCLIRYLYQKLNELVKHEVKEDESIFSAIPASNRFELKKNLKLSLFLSEPPDNCGTVRSNRPTRTNTGTESDTQSVRLKSTTDKISVWNQVGIQGSLLTHFINAIFISNITIPVEFNENSFHRHFVLNYPKEPKLSKCDTNIIANIAEQIDRVRVHGYQNVATNWIRTDDSLEIIDCKTGKAMCAMAERTPDECLSISRLSKHELNKCFRDFLTNYEHSLRPHQSMPMTYRKWKESAPNYRIQKQLLKVRYAVAGRQWICLPSDLDLFV